MAFELDLFLLNQAIRMQRVNWGTNAKLLGDEIFSILSSIQVQHDVGPVQVDENNNPIIINTPDIPGITLPPDLDLPESPFRDPPVVNDGENGFDDNPDNDPGENSTRITQKFWYRNSFVGKLVSGNTGDKFQCDLYRNGLNQTPTRITAQITDSTLAADVESGSWVTVHLIVQYEALSEQIGSQVQPTQLNVLSQEYLFNAPGSPGTGTWGTVTTSVTGYSSGLGEGFVRRQKKNESGTWVDDEIVPVKSTVSGSVAVGKVVQLKRVADEWFVDVEDCGSDEEPGGGGSG